MPGAGLIPERTTDPAIARRLWERDGASILVCDDPSPEALFEGCSAVFGDSLLEHQGLSQVAANPKLDGDTFFDAGTRTVYAKATEQLSMHVDGYMAFGECYPYLNGLLCVKQADAGGDSILVDGLRLVEAIDSESDNRDLSEFVWNTKIEQSRTPGTGPRGTGAPIPHRRPIARRTTSGRISVIYHEHQRLLDDRAPDPVHASLLKRWRDRMGDEAAAAPRFRLERGDLILMDNFRVVHGREPFQDPSRLLLKVWAWTDTSFGVPAVA